MSRIPRESNLSTADSGLRIKWRALLRRATSLSGSIRLDRRQIWIVCWPRIVAVPNPRSWTEASGRAGSEIAKCGHTPAYGHWKVIAPYAVEFWHRWRASAARFHGRCLNNSRVGARAFPAPTDRGSDIAAGNLAILDPAFGETVRMPARQRRASRCPVLGRTPQACDCILMPEFRLVAALLRLESSRRRAVVLPVGSREFQASRHA